MYRKYQGLSWITLLLSLIPIVALLIPIQSRMEAGMEEVRAVLMSQFEEELGVQVFYDSISPSIFQYVEIRNIQLVNQADQRTLLSVDRFRVHYSISDMLFNTQDSSGTSISIHRANLYVDLINKPYLFEYLSQEVEEAGGDSQQIDTFNQETDLTFTAPTDSEEEGAGKLTIYITNSFVTILGGDTSTTVAVNSATALFDNSNISFQLQGVIDGYELGTPVLSSDLKLNGQTENFFQTFVSTIKLREFQYNDIFVQGQSVQIYREGSVINASIIESSTPLELSLRYYIEEELIEADFIAEALDITEIFTLEDSVFPPNSITGRGSVTYSIPRKNAFYQANIEAFISDMLFSGDVQGNNGIITANNLSIERENLSGYYSGIVNLDVMGIEGTLTLMDESSKTEIVVDTTLEDTWTQYAIHITQGNQEIPEIAGQLMIDLPRSTAHVDISFLNHFYQLSGGFQSSTITLYGRESTDLDGSFELEGLQPFAITLKDFPIPLDAEGVESGFVSLRLSGTAGKDGGLSGSLEEFELSAFDTVIRAMGSYEDEIATISDLSVAMAGLLLEGEGDLQVHPVGDIAIGGEMNFIFSDAITPEEVYTILLDGSLQDLQVALDMPEIPVHRLLPNTQGRGHFVAYGEISGSVEAPQVTFDISSMGAQIRKNLVQGSLSLRGNLQEVVLNSRNFSYGGTTMRNLNLRGDLEELIFQGGTKVTSNFSGSPYTGDLNIFVTSGATSLEQVITAPIQGNISFTEFFLRGDRFPDIAMGLFGYNGTYNLAGGPESAIMATITKDGSFFANLTDTFPVGGTIFGYIRGDDMLIETEGLSADMSILNYLNIEDLTFYNGRAHGSIRISGSPQNPDWDGYLVANNHTATIKYIPGVMEVSDVLFTMKGKDATIHPFMVKLGEEHQATLSGGFNLDGLVFQELRLDIDADDRVGMAFAYPFDTLGVGVDGIVYGQFGIFASGAVLDLYGDIRTQRTTVTLVEKSPEILPSSGGGGGESILNVNLSVTMGRDVKFLWPDESFPILLAVVSPNSSIKVEVDGRNQKSMVTGDLKLRGGEIYYLQRSFYITSGSLLFNENETRFDPVLTVEAKLRDVDSLGERVDIYLSVPESPLSSFSPTFSSAPLKSDQEIIGILAGNFLPTNMEGERNLISAVSSVADLGFRQIDQVNSLIKQVRETLNLDILTIRTQFIQNLVLYQYSYFFGQQERAAPLITIFDNTTVTFGKTVTTNLYIQALFRLTTNSSSFITPAQRGILSFETEVGFEWDTPFFLLSISVQPDILEPMSLLRNTFCSASWRYTL